MRVLRSSRAAPAAVQSGPSTTESPSQPTTPATSETPSYSGGHLRPTVAIMCLLPVGAGSDGDCLFDALAYFHGLLAEDLRLQVAWYMELLAAAQAGFEGEWWQEAQHLRENEWQDVAAILSAYSLLWQVRIVVHARMHGNPTPVVTEASHAAVANNDAVPVRHILYNGPVGRFDVLVQVPEVGGFEQVLRCFPKSPPPFPGLHSGATTAGFPALGVFRQSLDSSRVP